MSFGLSGCHNSGKTTLAKAIADAAGIPFFETKTSELLAEIGISGVGVLDMESRFLAQDHLLNRFWEISQAHARPFISDRTPLDYIGYMLAEVTMHNTSAELGARVDAFVERAINAAANTLMGIIIVDRLPGYDADLKRPPVNLAYQLEHQLLVRGASARLGNTDVFHIHTTSASERLDYALAAINESTMGMEKLRVQARHH